MSEIYTGSVAFSDTREAYAVGYARGLNAEGWRPGWDASDSAKAWKGALSQHAETSYYGVAHIQVMRAYWLGVMRGAGARGVTS